jgi:hypothetical protein
MTQQQTKTGTARGARSMIETMDRVGLREVAQADQLIAALGEAFPAREAPQDRRQEPRYRYQVRARLELVDQDGRPVESRSLHTRDVSAAGTGFVASSEVSDDARAVLHLPSPNGAAGETTKVACRVRRSREAGNGWFEGVVEFDDRQPVFSSTRIEKK